MQADINVTPLVDVCLVLLIIFMVVMPVMVNGVPVQLPRTAHAPEMAKENLPITVKDDGTVYVGSVVVRREEIAAEMKRQHEKNPARPIVVRGDKRVAYGEVVDVLDACRAAGFSDVGLVSERK